MGVVVNPELACQLAFLEERGVKNTQQFASLDAKVIEETLRWFDQQGGRVGLGVLVNELRAGGRKLPSKRNVLAQQAEYGTDVQEWLDKNFPAFSRPVWGPHPAAVAAVAKLDFVHGKSNRRKSTYGPAVRSAVREWERKFGPEHAA